VSGSPPSLEEVRARLRVQGYLDAGIERAIFSAPKASGAILPSAIAGALACAVASAGACWARGAVTPPAGAVAVAAALALVETPFALVVGAAVLLRTRLRRAPSHPGRASLVAAFSAALLVFGLFTFGVRSLPPGPDAQPWPALAVVTVAAFYFARAARATSLSLALRRQVALPERFSWRRGSAAGVALFLAVISAYLWRTEPPARFPALTISPRSRDLVVVGLDGVTPEALALVASGAPLSIWRRAPANPPEVWTTIATGVPASRHGVAAFERVSLFREAALTPPIGTAWAFRGPLRSIGAADRLPVSAAQRRAYTFWEIAARAGLPTVAVNWWASEKTTGAEIVDYRDVAVHARSGAEDDAEAIARFHRMRDSTRPRLATIYLPGADIDGTPISNVTQTFLAEEMALARAGGEMLWVIADSGRRGSSGGWALLDPQAVSGGRSVRPEDVTPTIIARLGIPAARDLTGASLSALFAPGALEAASVSSYGDRLPTSKTLAPTETGREYLEKLKSLGYLQ